MRTLRAVDQPERIRVPVLALYDVPQSTNDLVRPWYDAGDRDIQSQVKTLYLLSRERVEHHQAWLRGHAGPVRVFELSGGHFLFLTRSREVLNQIEAFAASLSSQ